jgi:hypothetical protein
MPRFFRIFLFPFLPIFYQPTRQSLLIIPAENPRKIPAAIYRRFIPATGKIVKSKNIFFNRFFKKDIREIFSFIWLGFK